MACVGTTRREGDSSIILVLEHRRERHDVSVFSFPTGSRRHSRLSAELHHLHPKFDAYPEAQVCAHCRCSLAKAARNRITKHWLDGLSDYGDAISPAFGVYGFLRRCPRLP